MLKLRRFFSWRPAIADSLARCSIQSRGRCRRALRVVAGGLLLALLLFAALLLSLRFYFLPHIQDYRADVAGLLSRSLGLRVEIGQITSGWQGIRPALGLEQVRLFDPQGRPALGLDGVQAVLSWSSLLRGKLVLARLEVAEPELSMRREPDGRILIAGIALNAQSEGTGFQDWLLVQKNIVISDARLLWDDAQRQAPTLDLSHVNLTLENAGARHRFSLKAEPPVELARRLEIRGELKGRGLDHPEGWHGEIQANAGHADLAIWRQWLDYPIDLPQGKGDLKLALKLDQGRMVSASADFGLSRVRLRLAPDLPELDLESMAGGLNLELSGQAFELQARNLVLETRAGIRLAPTDLRVRYSPAEKGLLRDKPARGEASAGSLDLDVLRALFAYLPLDKQTHKHLSDYAPRGALTELKLTWQGDREAVTAYSLQTRFDRLGVAAVGEIPGFEGLSGSIEANEKEGSLNLEARNAALFLPRIFPEPRLGLDHLQAKVDWTRQKLAPGELAVHIKQLNFANADAEGNVSGSYLYQPGSPGSIDLNAQLTRGDGRAVWRYMPLAVNQDTRDWLREGIISGGSRDARLRLKGALKDFPFADGKSGIFQVTAKFQNVGLHYAPGWPEIQAISGNLLFEGKRMLIRVGSGRLYGVNLAQVVAELPDLMANDEVMRIKGQAHGPTGDFLRFIDESPVAERIGHFTEGMKAEGNGRLDLSLVLPLRHIQDSLVQGDYQFIANRLLPEPGLPPLTEINGRLQFTGQGVSVKSATGYLLGGPLGLSAVTRSDGSVLITAQGSLPMTALAKEVELPLLAHLSGTAAWRGQVTVRQRHADLLLDSTLNGIASSLPEPFNKSATESLPLHLEKLQLPASKEGTKREMLRIGLGKVLLAQWQRRLEGGHSLLESGAVIVQSPVAGAKEPELPTMLARRLNVVGRLDAVNLDFWRQFLPENKQGHGGGANATPPLLLDLKTRQLTAFGRTFADIGLQAEGQNGVWDMRVTSPDMAGDVSWNSRDQGRLKAHLRYLSLGEEKEAGMRAVQEPLRQLPALDVLVDHFRLRNVDLGKLELEAVNQNEGWLMRRIGLSLGDSTLLGSGDWQLRTHGGNEGKNGTEKEGGSHSRLNFKLESGSAGKLLDRLGYPGLLRNGETRLEGELNWDGPPTSVDYKSLQGRLTLDTGRGQFAKLNPGVGRLLGILSLQSLPRRITLDFNDIFSQGFAFDAITGDVQVQRGVFSSQNLRIQGPSARILMTGDADINRETQDLLVRIQPAVGETLSVGTMLVHPTVGFVTYLAQKLLKDPLGHAFEFDYRITGAWNDPKVEKVRAGPVDVSQDKDKDKTP